MASVTDQHQNREVLLDLKRTLDENAAVKAESEQAVRRTRLVSLGTQPIVTQIKELGSLDLWCQEYRHSEVPKNKVDQIVALERLQEWLWRERSQSAKALEIAVQFDDDLPPSKRQQYDERLRRCLGEKWHECFVRLYTAAEWALEKWAKTGLRVRCR